MKMYKIYNYERDVLIRQTIENNGKYNPVKDVNGVYFISEVEHNQCGLGMLAEYVAPEPAPL